MAGNHRTANPTFAVRVKMAQLIETMKANNKKLDFNSLCAAFKAAGAPEAFLSKPNVYRLIKSLHVHPEDILSDFRTAHGSGSVLERLDSLEKRLAALESALA